MRSTKTGRWSSPVTTTGKDRPQREHHAILKACAGKKVDDAVRLLEEHIEETRKSLVAAVRLARRVA